MKKARPKNHFGQFIDLLCVKKNTDRFTIASMLKTTPAILQAASNGRLNEIPSVWVDRLVDAYHLPQLEEQLLTAAVQVSNQAADRCVKRTFYADR